MTCPQCGAPQADGTDCTAFLHELLALEWQVLEALAGEADAVAAGLKPHHRGLGAPGRIAHFLAVGSFNLQHAAAFAPAMVDGLAAALADVVHGRAPIDAILARTRTSRRGAPPVLADRTIAPGARQPPRPGWPVRWPLTVLDACRVPPERYCGAVLAWAEAVDATLAARRRG